MGPAICSAACGPGCPPSESAGAPLPLLAFRADPPSACMADAHPHICPRPGLGHLAMHVCVRGGWPCECSNSQPSLGCCGRCHACTRICMFSQSACSDSTACSSPPVSAKPCCCSTLLIQSASFLDACNLWMDGCQQGWVILDNNISPYIPVAWAASAALPQRSHRPAQLPLQPRPRQRP